MNMKNAALALVLLTIPAVVLGQTAGWTENSGKTTTSNQVGVGPVFAQPAPAAPTATLDVDGTLKLRDHLLLGVGKRLSLWPDLSGSYISGNGIGISLVGMGGQITLSNADTAITGYGTTALTVTAASGGANVAKFNDSAGATKLSIAGTGATTFTSSAYPNTSTIVNGGVVALNGYPTKLTLGNGQSFMDNSGGNLRIFGGYDMQLDTVNGEIVLWPGFPQQLAQTRIVGNMTTTNAVTIGTAFDSQTLRLTVHGGVTVDGNIAAKYQDVAEWVPAAESMSAGTVVVLNQASINEVVPSSEPYDTTVAGVVSAQPGLILGEAARSKAKIATTGRVRVRVDASRAPIRIGDLLVTSGKRGTAMRSEPLEVAGAKLHRPGTLIGKALEPLKSGEGEILVLLSLQ
jgi:hypothetical protein